MIKIDSLASTPTPSVNRRSPSHEEAMAQAKEFESVFVAQMLKHSGFEKALSGNSGFGGESYASLLLEQYAARMTERGGFGLAEKIYDQLIDRESENGPK